MKLTIELVPVTSFYQNVRSEVSPKEWDRIRRICYAAAGHRCELCGGVGKRHAVECHEIWDYREQGSERYQVLTGFIALCPSCHQVKHPGQAEARKGARGVRDVLEQLVKVNQITLSEAAAYYQVAFHTWRKRSRYTWTLDISYLTTYLTQ